MRTRKKRTKNAQQTTTETRHASYKVRCRHRERSCIKFVTDKEIQVNDLMILDNSLKLKSFSDRLWRKSKEPTPITLQLHSSS